MEREIVELRKQIAEQTTPTKVNGSTSHNATPSGLYTSADQYGSNEAVEGLMGLSGGLNTFKRIEDVLVMQDSISELFNVQVLCSARFDPCANLLTSFFSQYHPFLPFLDQKMTPEEYFNYCPPLFWSTLSVGARRYQADTTLLNRLVGPVTRLIWSALADMKQMYGVVKALCLLCTWPFPTSSTSTDPTFMFSGVMMQIAMQIGLHRPSHAQDFSKFRMELQEDELKDRARTWAICNIVAQRWVTYQRSHFNADN
jgi:Fungal specific transcription factor domain